MVFIRVLSTYIDGHTTLHVIHFKFIRKILIRKGLVVAFHSAFHRGLSNWWNCKMRLLKSFDVQLWCSCVCVALCLDQSNSRKMRCTPVGEGWSKILFSELWNMRTLNNLNIIPFKRLTISSIGAWNPNLMSSQAFKPQSQAQSFSSSKLTPGLSEFTNHLLPVHLLNNRTRSPSVLNSLSYWTTKMQLSSVQCLKCIFKPSSPTC